MAKLTTRAKAAHPNGSIDVYQTRTGWRWRRWWSGVITHASTQAYTHRKDCELNLARTRLAFGGTVTIRWLHQAASKVA